MSRILIVDDDPQLGRSLERILGHEGHDCRIVEDPILAANAAVTFQPDAILIELQSSHLETLERLRDALGVVPVVFMTGHQEAFARLGELVGPYDDWVAKPAVPAEFIVRINTALRRAKH
jgi:DNA-binding response OmpR family regulator